MGVVKASVKGSNMKVKDPAGFVGSRIEKQMSLFEQEGIPLTPEGTAPINNHLARSPLFAPIKRGARKHHKRTLLASQGDTKIKFWGEQLDMADQNVLLHAYHLAAGTIPMNVPDGKKNPIVPDDMRVAVDRAEFLRAIGMAKSGQNYEWLHESLMRLATCLIEIDTKHYRANYQLIGPPQFDKETETYYFYVPRSAFAFFTNSSFGYVNMERRLSLEKHVDLASWIQSFVVTHSKDEEHSFSLKYLRDLCGQTRPIRKFRQYFTAAVKELMDKGEFEKAEVTPDDMFKFKRPEND